MVLKRDGRGCILMDQWCEGMLLLKRESTDHKNGPNKMDQLA